MVTALNSLRIIRNSITEHPHGEERGMYDYIDQPVDRLGGGSRFVLWAMRAWSNARRLGTCPRVCVAGAFVNLGAAAAVRDFHVGMARLATAPGRPIAFAPIACGRVAEGEAVLLAIWAMLAKRRHDAARDVLRLMVPAATAELLVAALAAAADHLDHAGLRPDDFGNAVQPSDNSGNG